VAAIPGQVAVTRQDLPPQFFALLTFARHRSPNVPPVSLATPEQDIFAKENPPKPKIHIKTFGKSPAGRCRSRKGQSQFGNFGPK
jgi:hypothetical protein